jgi:predicted amidohydrolase YtcJ
MASADVVFRNGSIFTAGQKSSQLADVAVLDGVIVAVGEDVDQLVGVSTRIVDLTGRLLVPGFQDAHAHPVMGGVEMLQCDLTESESAEDCLRLIAEYAAANPVAEWVLGGGWSMDHFEGGTPTRQQLDAVVADRPVVLSNRDHHGTWANSLALSLAGITAATPDPIDGRIERDVDGAPSGTLHEGAADLLTPVRPAIDEELAYRGLLRAQTGLLSLGVTGWQDACVGSAFGMPDILPVYLRAVANGDLLGRVTAALWWERAEGIDQLDSLLERRQRAAVLAHPERFTAGTVKIMVDGVAENFTAAMSAPYLDDHGHSTGNTGLSFIDSADLKRFVTALDAKGFQVHFHALGDRAVTEALDAVEAARAANGRTGNRHHLAHLQVVDDRDIPRFVELEASANLQSLWACVETQLLELTFPFLEPELIRQHYPFGSLDRAGVHLVAGSDWPVSSANPMLAIHVAVNRVAPGGGHPPLGDEREKLSLATALTAYTAGSAYINGRETSTGRIEVGYMADLAVLDRDPFAGAPEDIHLSTVESTWIDGRCVYDSKEGF